MVPTVLRGVFMGEPEDSGVSASMSLVDFEAALEVSERPEEKLRLCLEFLQKMLAQEGPPRFREFWQVRDTAVGLFKEGIHPAVRAKAWAELSELSREARCLKAHQKAQSAFTIEQLELAANALETEIEGEAQGTPFELPASLELSGEVKVQYQQLQTTLEHLARAVQQLTALKSELALAGIRGRERAHLSSRLQALGEKLFGKRKSLSQELASLLTRDVQQFSERLRSDLAHQPAESDRASRAPKRPVKGSSAEKGPFWLREQIKAWQLVAKQLLVGRRTFEECRKCLCEAWEYLSHYERKRKEELLHRREKQSARLQELSSAIEALIASYDSKRLGKTAFSKQLDEIRQKIRKEDLGVREKRTLRELLETAEDGPSREGRAQMELECARQAHRLTASSELAKSLETRIQALSGVTCADIHQGLAERERLLKELESALLLPEHKNRLMRSLEPLSDELLLEAEGLRIASATAREELEEVLSIRRERQGAMRALLAEYSRLAESSGLDFATAMDYRDRVEFQRERIKAIDAAIHELEQKLEQWQAVQGAH